MSDRYAYGGLLFVAAASAVSIAGVNIAIGLTCLALGRGFLYQKKLSWTNIDSLIVKAGFFFLATVFLSTIEAQQPIVVLERGGTYFLRMLPFFLVACVVQNERQLYQLLIVAAMSLLVADMCALWQGFQGNLRAPAFHSHPMMLAGFLVQWIPSLALLAAVDWGKQLVLKKYWRWGLSCLWLLSMAALVVNGTRGAWLAVLFLLLVLGTTLLCKHKKNLAIGCVVLVLLVSAAGQHSGLQERVHTMGDVSFQSNSERLLMWQSAWNMFLDHPLTGVGAQNYVRQYQNQYISPLAKERDQVHAHNNFLQILAEQGLIGFAAFCLLFGVILWRGWQGMKSNGLWGYMLFFSTMGLLLQGLTEFNFGNSAVIRLYWLLAGIAAAGLRLEKNKAR